MTFTSPAGLFERAAAEVTPSETHPAERMAALGRRSVRRRRFLKAAGAAALVGVAVATMPFLTTRLNPADQAAGATGKQESYGGLTVTVPDGWKIVRAGTFDSCTAEANTAYFAEQWDFMKPDPGPGGRTPTCTSNGKEWMAVLLKGMGKRLEPDLQVVNGGRLVQAERPDQDVLSMKAYTVIEDTNWTALFISGDDPLQRKLLGGVTWPPGPPAPASGGLAIPANLTSVTTDGVPPTNGMMVVEKKEVLALIGQKLGALRDPVPPGESCVLNAKNSYAMSLAGAGDQSARVFLGEATCPQAVSTAGGAVRIPPGLAAEMRQLVRDNAL